MLMSSSQTRGYMLNKVLHLLKTYYKVKPWQWYLWWGVNPRMVTTADTVTSTVSKPWSYISTMLPQKRTHLKQNTAVVGVMVNLLNVSSTTEPIQHRIGSVVELRFNTIVAPKVPTSFSIAPTRNRWPPTCPSSFWLVYDPVLSMVSSTYGWVISYAVAMLKAFSSLSKIKPSLSHQTFLGSLLAMPACTIQS